MRATSTATTEFFGDFRTAIDNDDPPATLRALYLILAKIAGDNQAAIDHTKLAVGLR